MDVRKQLGSRGDGMTFLLSANKSFTGWAGGAFRIFSGYILFVMPFKSVVVEFDTYMNINQPVIHDINSNHVSFDFVNITPVVADATYHMDLGDENTKYVWVEYSRDTQKLEVRVNYNNTRPTSPLLNYTMNLLHFVEEYI